MPVKIQSITKEHDFQEFKNNWNPDLTATLDWIENNLEIPEVFNMDITWKPEYVFSDNKLKEWAEQNNFVDENSTISKKEFLKIVKLLNKLSPIFDECEKTEKYQKEISNLLNAIDDIG